ncbi:MAG: YihY/virulence factor BrkB family protein [Bacteroidaceae bacterium]|nr:YihY/virulence factor BrkB family protein [Bacteroidaceae bacterium]
MAKIKKFRDYVSMFIDKGMWMNDHDNWFVRLVKRGCSQLYTAGRLFIKKELIDYATSLAFSTIFAIVPMVALLFAIAQGFGFGSYIENSVRDVFSSQPQIAEEVLNLSKSYLTNAQGYVVIGFGIILMLYSITMLIRNVEHVFNMIWDVDTYRPLKRMLTEYVAMLFILPILIIIISGINIFSYNVANSLQGYEMLEPMSKFLIQISPFLFMTLVFICMYVLIPNTRVRVSTAILPGILASLFMSALQYVYVHGQILLSSYNRIYGSLAALPLFMLWMLFVWYIILFFAQYNYASQNHEDFMFNLQSSHVSHRERMRMSAVILKMIFKRFANGESPMTSFDIKKATNYPISIIKELLTQLTSVNILSENITAKSEDESTYQPAEDIARITLAEMIKRMEDLHDVTASDLQCETGDKEIDSILTDFDSCYQQFLTEMGKKKIY